MKEQLTSEIFLRQDWEREASKDLIFSQEKINLDVGEWRYPSSSEIPKIIVKNEENVRNNLLPF